MFSYSISGMIKDLVGLGVTCLAEQAQDSFVQEALKSGCVPHGVKF